MLLCVFVRERERECVCVYLDWSFQTRFCDLETILLTLLDVCGSVPAATNIY